MSATPSDPPLSLRDLGRTAASAMAWLLGLIALLVATVAVHGTLSVDDAGFALSGLLAFRGVSLLALVFIPALVAGEVDGWLTPSARRQPPLDARTHLARAVIAAFAASGVVGLGLFLWVLAGLGERMGPFVLGASVVVVVVQRFVLERVDADEVRPI